MTALRTPDRRSRGLVAWAAVVSSTVVSIAGTSDADAPSRSLEAASGITFMQSARQDTTPWGGAILGARWYATSALHLDPVLSYGLGADVRDPERGEVFHALGAGVGLGVRLPMTRFLALQPSVRADWLRAWGWRDDRGSVRGVRDGARVSAGLGLALSLGTVWGHAFGFEPRVDATAVFLPGAYDPFPPLLQGSLWFTGVLFPEPGLSPR